MGKALDRNRITVEMLKLKDSSPFTRFLDRVESEDFHFKSPLIDSLQVF